MEQSTQLAKKPIPKDLELDPRQIEILSYIHSNKFITSKLFQKKFHATHSHSRACSHLREFVKRGLLLKIQKLPIEDAYYCLTRPALHQLYALARIIISHEVRSPHINPFEREHDKRVLQMRVQIESDPTLAKLTWLSDYEMRCGLRMEWKKALQTGQGWDLSKAKLHRFHKRTPDGYFETTINGTPYAFVLEYEHSPYKREKMEAMYLNLAHNFPRSIKLIVSRDYEHAIRMIGGLGGYLKANSMEKPLWAFSYFEKVSTVPFTRVTWATLEGKYLPFVKDPILRQSPEATQPTEAKPETLHGEVQAEVQSA